MKALDMTINDVKGVWTPSTDITPSTGDLKPGYISENFRVTEFDCNHCGKYGDLISKDLLVVLEKLRDYFVGLPVTVNSGVRCPTHNRNVGGARNSTHLSEGSVAGYPCAADVRVKNVSPDMVHDYLVKEYPGKYGIGKYSSFTHIDTRPHPARW